MRTTLRINNTAATKVIVIMIPREMVCSRVGNGGPGGSGPLQIVNHHIIVKILAFDLLFVLTRRGVVYAEAPMALKAIMEMAYLVSTLRS